MVGANQVTKSSNAASFFGEIPERQFQTHDIAGIYCVMPA